MNDLIELLSSKSGAEGLTTAEILESMKQPVTHFYRNKLLMRLKEEVKAGRVECAQSERIRIDGRPSKVPVYRRVVG